jgi:hypothetical protein
MINDQKSNNQTTDFELINTNEIQQQQQQQQQQTTSIFMPKLQIINLSNNNTSLKKIIQLKAIKVAKNELNNNSENKVIFLISIF